MYILGNSWTKMSQSPNVTPLKKKGWREKESKGANTHTDVQDELAYPATVP